MSQESNAPAPLHSPRKKRPSENNQSTTVNAVLYLMPLPFNPDFFPAVAAETRDSLSDSAFTGEFAVLFKKCQHLMILIRSGKLTRLAIV